jgi:hypothetical protein
MRKIHMLFDAQRHGAASGKEIAALIEAADFPVKDQHARWIIDRAYQHNPDDITSALLHRLEAGRELPFRVESLLQAAGIAIDHGPVVDLVMEPGTRERAAVTAVCIVGPQTVGRLIDNVVAISAKLRAYEQRGDEATRQEYHRLLNWISNTGRASFIQAVLSRSATKEPDEIALLAELLARHGGGESDGALQLTGELHERMVAAVGRWAELLLASPTASRTQLAEVARAIGRLAAPSLVPVLKHMLAEDLARWRRTRDESMAARSRGINIQSDAHMSWALQYRRAFAAIGDGQVVQAMKAYLPDGGFGGFGVDAAIVLKEIWDREQNFPKDTQFKSWPDFSEVKTQRMEREKRGAGGETTPFADVILAVVNDLAKPEAGDDAHRHALGLANIAFSMPYGNKTELISTLLQLPLPLAAKQGLLTILVLAGEIIRADMVLDGIKALLEEATTKRWLLDENQWTLERWLELIPFSDRPGATIDALELLEPPLRVPRRLRRLLSALGQAPADEAELILEQLARTDERFFAEHDWLAALEQRGTASAGRMLLNLISEGTLGGGRGGLETWTLSKKLASGMHAHRAFRAEVYERYMGLSGGLGKAIVEGAIAEAADAEGVMILVRGYAAHGKPLDGTLYTAIRHVTVGERPSSNWAGASELFSVSAPELRKNLFGMVYGNAAEARLAAACLTSIDEIRDDYGEAESEPGTQTSRPVGLGR